MAILQICYTTFIHTWAAVFCSTSWLSPSLSHSGERLASLPRGGAVLPPFLPQLGVAPLSLACPSFCYQQSVCSNSSYITNSSPPITITQVLTFLHILALWVHDTLYIYVHSQFTIFLLVLLLDLQAGQLAPNSYRGNNYVQCLLS